MVFRESVPFQLNQLPTLDSKRAVEDQVRHVRRARGDVVDQEIDAGGRALRVDRDLAQRAVRDSESVPFSSTH